MRLLSKPLLITSLYLCAFCQVCLAQPDYVIGTEAIEYYPHYGKNYPNSTEFSGYARDILDAFGLQEKLSIKYSPLPIKRLYKSFLYDQSLDFKYPDCSDWKPQLRKNLRIYYSGPVGHYTDGVIVNKFNKPKTVNEIKKLGTIRGFTPVPFRNELDNGKIQLFEFSKTSDLLSALLAMKIDAAYLNLDVARYQIELYFNDYQANFMFDKTLPYVEGNYQISSIKHPDIINKLNQFLRNNPDIISNIANKYHIKPPVFE